MRGKICHGIRIAGGHEIVFQQIKLLAKKNGFCWATNETIAKITGYSADYVSHIITDLYRIGWLYRRVELDRNNAFVARVLVPMDKLYTPDEMEAKISELEAKKDTDGIRNRLCKNGEILGISPVEIRRAIYQYGAERIEELLCIIYASNTCKSPRRFFYAGLKKAFIIGERAKKWIGKVFVFEKPSFSNEKRVLGNRTIAAAIEEVSQPMNPYFAQFLNKKPAVVAALE